MMRQGPHSKRLRGRGNGRKNVNVRSQNFESNGPDVKVRGNAQQVVEKYLQLARDATSSGDRITAESYFQHAEHYYRLMTANNPGNGSGNGHDGIRDGRGPLPQQAAAGEDPPPMPGEGPQPDVVEDPGASPQSEGDDGSAPAST